jgi:DNA polymerase III epsilon subunit-like protein
MYLFFDTETTGLPLNWKAPVTDLSNWPRLVQLAYLVYDESGRKLHEQSAIIRPDGWTIGREAAAVHGITDDRAKKEGVPLRDVMQELDEHMLQASTLVAHNMAFDSKIVGAEYLRTSGSNPLDRKRKLCTMETSTNILKLPGHYGFKWPKLDELHNYLFGEGFEGAHDAGADIRATARCFWELRKRRAI